MDIETKDGCAADIRTAASLPPGRPASHKWAIAFLSFLSFAFVLLVVNLLTGRAPLSAELLYMLTMGSIGVVGWCCLVFGRRKVWAYFATCFCLGFFLVKALHSACMNVVQIVNGRRDITPSFHVVETDKPFITVQPVTSLQLLGGFIMFGLLLWLFLRFMTGRPSRSYYGLPPIGKRADQAGATRVESQNT